MQLITEAKRIFLLQTHFAYLQRHNPNQRFLWGWRRTSTMIASRVFADDEASQDAPQVIVTTFFLNGRIRHEVEQVYPL
jgi:hypothetical protein